MTSALAAGALLLVGALLLGAGVTLLLDAEARSAAACGPGGQAEAVLQGCALGGPALGWLSSILGSAAFFAGLTMALRRHAASHPEEWDHWEDERR